MRKAWVILIALLIVTALVAGSRLFGAEDLNEVESDTEDDH